MGSIHTFFLAENHLKKRKVLFIFYVVLIIVTIVLGSNSSGPKIIDGVFLRCVIEANTLRLYHVFVENGCYWCQIQYKWKRKLYFQITYLDTFQMIYDILSGNINFWFLMSHVDTLSLNAILLQFPSSTVRIIYMVGNLILWPFQRYIVLLTIEEKSFFEY